MILHFKTEDFSPCVLTGLDGGAVSRFELGFVGRKQKYN